MLPAVDFMAMMPMPFLYAASMAAISSASEPMERLNGKRTASCTPSRTTSFKTGVAVCMETPMARTLPCFLRSCIAFKGPSIETSFGSSTWWK